MTGLSLNDDDRLALAAAGVAEGPDGALRSASGSIVSPGVAAALISRGDGLGKAQSGPAMSTVSPDQFHRGYIAAGHASDSPANGPRGVIPEPPEGGGRSSSLCTTPDDDGPADGAGVEKVVAAEDFARGYLEAGHAAPSPADQPGNSVAPPVTGSGHERYQAGAAAYEASRQAERAGHAGLTGCITSKPAVAEWSPPADLGARNVPETCNPSSLTGHAPGER